jgi:hypothetical protein
MLQAICFYLSLPMCSLFTKLRLYSFTSAILPHQTSNLTFLKKKP